MSEAPPPDKVVYNQVPAFPYPPGFDPTKPPRFMVELPASEMTPEQLTEMGRWLQARSRWYRENGTPFTEHAPIPNEVAARMTPEDWKSVPIICSNFAPVTHDPSRS